MTNPQTCFILAAGLGKRLRPITNHVPKPLLPIAGRPLLELLIEKAVSAGACRIGINTHHLHVQVEEWMSGSAFREMISLYHEEPILDTGGALKNAAAFLSGGDFIVHNGDIVSDINLSMLLEQHKLSGNIATLAVLDYPAFNNVIIGHNGLLKSIGRTFNQEEGEKIVAFSGIAAYSADFLRFLPAGASSVVDAWRAATEAGLRVGTFDAAGSFWSDIGSPASYASVLVRKLNNEGEFVHIDSSAQLCDDILLDGHIVIEKGTVLGKASSLRNCIILPGGKVEPGVHYENSIIGKDYEIPVDESAFSILAAGKGALIGTGGSDRKYFRAREKGRSVVLMECRQDDPDFARHIEYTRFFNKHGIPVPEMHSHDPEKKSAYFEDLGDISLYSWLKLRRGDPMIELAYQKVLAILVRLHAAVTDHITECPALLARVFDYDHLRWETSYFIERFAKSSEETGRLIPPSLDEEFHRLALRVDSFSKRIIHRDFQSQNIMMTRCEVPRIIDFQGARMAPPAYDIASFLWDPYAPLKDDMRLRLLDYYVSLISDAGSTWFSTAEFSDSLLYCRLQRHMQALGAYGYLSGIKGKTYFLRHVPEALRLLREETVIARAEFPSLHDMVSRL